MGKKFKNQLSGRLQKCLEENGPQSFLYLGKIDSARDALKECRKALGASKKWQRVEKGVFCFNGKTYLSFCARLCCPKREYSALS